MKFIQAINALGPIPSALILIVLGGFFMLVFKWAGLSAEDVKTGHDIVIAGISFISGIAVATRSHSSGDAANPTSPVDPAQPKS